MWQDYYGCVARCPGGLHDLTSCAVRQDCSGCVDRQRGPVTGVTDADSSKLAQIVTWCPGSVICLIVCGSVICLIVCGSVICLIIWGQLYLQLFGLCLIVWGQLSV